MRREGELPDDIRRQITEKKPFLWINTHWSPITQAQSGASLHLDHVIEVAARLQRYEPLLRRLFPELEATGGIIESPLIPQRRCRKPCGAAPRQAAGSSKAITRCRWQAQSRRGAGSTKFLFMQRISRCATGLFTWATICRRLRRRRHEACSRSMKWRSAQPAIWGSARHYLGIPGVSGNRAHVSRGKGVEKGSLAVSRSEGR